MYIAIDVGGTKTTVASYKSLSPEGKLTELTFATEQNFNKGLTSLKEAIQKLSKNSKIHGIGICLPGEIKDDDLYGATNLRNWENRKIVDKIKHIFNTKVRVEQDSACAALADALFGNMKNSKSFFHFIIGTGLGGASVEKVNSKWKVTPAEVCLMIVNAEGRRHSSLKVRGLLESYTAGKDLEFKLRKPLKNISDDHSIWNEVAKYLAIGIVNISLLLKPEAITFSGGLITKRRFLIQKIKEELMTFKDLKIHLPKVMLSSLKDNTALLGALAILK